MMLNYTPEQLKTWTEGTWHGAPESGAIRLNGFSNDSRLIDKAQGFIALKTSQRDGHTFLESVAQAGAGAALVQRFDDSVDIPQLKVKNVLRAFQQIAREHRLRFPGKVIGITGSCGKTSTKDLLALLLGERTLKTQANHNNHLGVPLTLTEIDRSAHDFAVVEAGINEIGEMEVLADMIRPDITIITTIATAHLEKLKTLENVAEEKTKLAQSSDGPVLFPYECLRLKSKAFERLSERAIVLCPEGKSTKRYAAQEFVYYKTKTETQAGCRLTLSSATFGEATFSLPILSRGMISNAGLAIVAALRCGVSLEAIQTALDSWEISGMRGELVTTDDKTFYVDCYNANPASMVDTFEVFKQKMTSSMPRLYVLGCMEELGLTSNALHTETGRKLKLREKDRAIIIGTQATAFCEGIMEAGNTAQQVQLFSTLSEVRKEVSAFKGAVLLKGSRRYALEKLLPEGKETDS